MADSKPKSMADKCRAMAHESTIAETRAFWLRMASYWDRNSPKKDEAAETVKLAF